MCYDAETSLLAFTLSYSIAWYLYNRNRRYDRWNAAFLMTFSTIQALEACLWSSANPEVRETVTKAILFVLLLQPVVQAFSGYQYTRSSFLYLLTAAAVGGLLWGVWRLARARPGEFSTTVGVRGHLIWNDSASPSSFLGPSLIGLVYLAGLFVPLLWMSDLRGLVLIFVGLATAAYSMVAAGPSEFSSMWCLVSIVYGLIAVAL